LTARSRPLGKRLAARARRRYLPLRTASAVLVVGIAATGCGATHRRPPTLTTGYQRLGVPTGGPHETPRERRSEHLLVREPLQGGGYFVISAIANSSGRAQGEIRHHVELPGAHGLESGGWSSGPRLGGVEPRILAVHVDHGCSGADAYALAYGLLRQPEDTVTAHDGGKAVVFKKVDIPASFHPGGVLVYELLGPDATNVVTRTPSGRVASTESFSGQDAISCG
jgi:hypothetical protein